MEVFGSIVPLKTQKDDFLLNGSHIFVIFHLGAAGVISLYKEFIMIKGIYSYLESMWGYTLWLFILVRVTAVVKKQGLQQCLCEYKCTAQQPTVGCPWPVWTDRDLYIKHSWLFLCWAPGFGVSANCSAEFLGVWWGVLAMLAGSSVSVIVLLGPTLQGQQPTGISCWWETAQPGRPL